MSDKRDHAFRSTLSRVPGTTSLAFTHPEGVLHSTALSLARKREILAGWASDAHAVPNRPALRQLDSGAIVPLDAVLAALRSLDEVPPEHRTLPLVSQRPRGLAARWRNVVRFPRTHDDDDDPPPAPAAALPPSVELELRRFRRAAWAGAAA